MNGKSKDLLDQATTRILAEQEKIETNLNQLKRTSLNQTSQQVKIKLEEYKTRSLEELMASRNSRNNFKKKECKICEICLQIRQDFFKYSRISNKGFNTNHIYRICSFCQKTVQVMIEEKDTNPKNNLFTK